MGINEAIANLEAALRIPLDTYHGDQPTLAEALARVDPVTWDRFCELVDLLRV